MSEKIKTGSILTGMELSGDDINMLLDLAQVLKQDRLKYHDALIGKHLALIFEKPSFRTRLSFTVAMRELGGDVIESVNATRKKEEPEDQMRVLQGYCHAAMVRTHDDSDLERMASVANIPIINALTERYHPCQTLADLLTLKQRFGDLNGLTVTYLGDGNNILHSLLLMAPLVGVKVHFCCPNGLGPNAMLLKQAEDNAPAGGIKAFTEPAAAVQGVQAVYTDVWVSMGFEEKADVSAFEGFQVNEALMAQAASDAIFLHCMPMERGQEVSQTLPDAPCSAIFEQSENRLHVQKALLYQLLSK